MKKPILLALAIVTIVIATAVFSYQMAENMIVVATTLGVGTLSFSLLLYRLLTICFSSRSDTSSG